MASRFRRAWILAGVVLVFFAAGVASAQETGKKLAGTAVPAIVAEKDGGSLAGGGSAPLDIPTERILLVFLVLCGLIYLTYFGLKRYVAWSKASTAKKRSCAVLDTVPLGGKRFVSVTRIYDRVLVLGVGEDSITLLTELGEEQGAPAAVPAAARPKTAEHFLQMLSGLTRGRRDAAKGVAAKSAETETAIL